MTLTKEQEGKRSPTEQHSDGIPILGNARLALPILLLLTFLTISGTITNASACGNVPAKLSSQILYCIPANIVNTQGTGTIINFQQQFSGLPFNALVGNVVVYNGLATSASNSLLPCWAESTSMIWCNLGANTIPASSSANGIYYFGIGNSITSFLSTTFGNDIGIAPQYTSTYGKYDNGNTVFNYYTNFYGTSLPAGWTSGGTGSYTVNNGINLGGTINYYVISGGSYSTSNVIDWYGNVVTTNGNEGVGGFATATSWLGFGYQAGAYGVSSGGDLGYVAATMTYGAGTTDVFSTYVPVASTGNEMINYGTPTSISGITTTGFPYTIGWFSQTLANEFNAQWIRARAQPPGGVMPSTSYLSQGSASYVALSISPNPSVYGQNVILTATCNNGDTCDIDYPTLGTHIATGTTTSSYTYNGGTLAVGTYSNYYANDITTSSASSPQTITVNAYTFVSSSANPTAYETSSQSISFVMDIGSSFTTGNLLLQVYNGVATSNVAWDNQTVSGGGNTFNFNYNIPLLASNAIGFTYNAVLYTTTPLTRQGVVNTIAQTEYENYFPQSSILLPANPSNVLLGTNITVNTIITQVNNLNAATVAGYVQIGNKQVSEYAASPYVYWGNVLSFNALAYGLANPTLGNPKTITANSIVQLSYNGNSVYRNVTGTTFKLYNESLEACSGMYPTNGITWNFYNVSTLSLWPGNVLVSGHFMPYLNGYTGSTQPASKVGFTATATANVYRTCIYPSWATFNVSGIFQYSANNTMQSTYQAVGLGVSNVVKQESLYLEYQPAPVDYVIYVLNQQNQVYIPALVYIYSYSISTNTSILINQLQVPSQSGGPITLEAGSQYTFAVYSPDGQTFLSSTSQPYTAAQCSSSPCSYILYINNYTIPQPTDVYGTITSTCMNTTTGTNQITTSCNFLSKSGQSNTFELQGYKNGILLGTPQCQQSLTAASGTLQCVFNNVTTTQYFWQLELNQNGAYSTLNNGYVGTNTNLFGSDGIWFAILIIITLAFLFLTRSIIVSIIAFDMGFTTMSFIGMIPDGLLVAPFMIIVSAVILYLANRK